MQFLTNKDKGNCGLAMAINYFVINGYTVSIPLNDTQDYDLIIEKEDELSRVQVKSTGFKTKYGIYQVSLKSMGGTKGKVYKTLVNTNVEYLFVLTEECGMYVFPKSKLTNRCTLNLNNSCDKYRVNI